MKKKLFSLLLSGIMIISLSACGAKEPGKEEVNVAVTEIGEKINSGLEFGSMAPLDDEMLKQYYGLDASILEAYTANPPMMNITTQEYSVFKVKDVKDVDTVKAAIDKRAEAVQKSFEQYLPDQYENAKNYYVDTNGKYLVFVIHKDVDKAKDIFQGFFN